MVALILSDFEVLPVILFTVLFYDGTYYCSSVFQYLIHQLVKLALKVPTHYSKFGKVIRNYQNKLGNRVLKSDLNSQ